MVVVICQQCNGRQFSLHVTAWIKVIFDHMAPGNDSDYLLTVSFAHSRFFSFSNGIFVNNDIGKFLSHQKETKWLTGKYILKDSEPVKKIISFEYLYIFILYLCFTSCTVYFP